MGQYRWYSMPYEWTKENFQSKFFLDKKHQNQIKNLEMICSMPEKGWQDIVLNLNKKLVMLDPEYKIIQIKEKFGILRFYYETNSKYISSRQAMMRYVSDAELASGYVCEKCGDPGNLVKEQYWRKTLCQLCLARRNTIGLYPPKDGV